MSKTLSEKAEVYASKLGLKIIPNVPKENLSSVNIFFKDCDF